MKSVKTMVVEAHSDQCGRYEEVDFYPHGDEYIGIGSESRNLYLLNDEFSEAKPDHLLEVLFVDQVEFAKTLPGADRWIMRAWHEKTAVERSAWESA